MAEKKILYSHMTSKSIPVFLIGLLCANFCSCQVKEQPAEIYFSQFKDNAIGVYTIIHDDFGGHWAHGIEDFADTMAYRRGIPFCFALIAGQCDEKDWENASRMIGHGHQVVNHSMNHKCGVESEWCTAGNWDEKDFHQEIDSSSDLIQRHTGKFSAFFMFPFDLHTDTMISYLKHQGFAGARAGTQNDLEDLHSTDPFHLNFKAFQPGYTQGNLDSFAMSAMEKRAWAIREVHGVQDESWGMINLRDYAGHLDNLQRWKKNHQLWVATLSDVLFYKMMKERYQMYWYFDPEMRINKVEFPERKDFKKENSKMYETLRTTATDKRMTLILQAQSNVSQVTQNGKSVSFRREKDKIIFDADPELGEVEIFYK